MPKKARGLDVSGAQVWYGQGTVRIKKVSIHPIEA